MWLIADQVMRVQEAMRLIARFAIPRCPTSIGPWVYLNFGTPSLTRYWVLPDRYLLFVYPPLLFCCPLWSSFTCIRFDRVPVPY